MRYVKDLEKISAHAKEFLLRIHMIVPIPKDTKWYIEFRDYNFPQVLTPHKRLNLVVVFMPGEPGSDSNLELSERGNTPDDSEDSNFLMDKDEDMEDQ